MSNMKLDEDILSAIEKHFVSKINSSPDSFIDIKDVENFLLNYTGEHIDLSNSDNYPFPLPDILNDAEWELFIKNPSITQSFFLRYISSEQSYYTLQKVILI